MARPSLLITGASGYIGSRLTLRAYRAGFRVIAAVRERPHRSFPDEIEFRRFDLREAPAASLLDGVDAVIHLAAIIREDSQPAGATENLNVAATRELLASARRNHVSKFLFLSSQSAKPDAPTSYGRSKWQIEQLFKGEGEIVVQPGMVTGGSPRGVYGSLLRLCRQYFILPVVNGSALVYPVHVDDLCDGILAIAAGVTPAKGTVRFAPSTALTFSEYIQVLASVRLGRAVIPVPVPAFPLVWANRVVAKIRGKPLVAEERLVGLAALGAPKEHRTDHIVSVPRIENALSVEGHRRRLLLEGRTFFRYVVGKRLPLMTVRRYVRAILNEEDNSPIPLPLFVMLWPSLLRCLEPFHASHRRRLSQRLRAATRIIEMTPNAAPVFHNYDRTPWLVAIMRLLLTAAAELLLLPIRTVLTRSGSAVNKR